MGDDVGLHDGLGFTVEYNLNETFGALEKRHVVELAVVDVTEDECGSTIYHASLMQMDYMYRPFDPNNQARFSLTLVDHSTRLCEDYKPNLWEANVREGWGWCGTMDSTMEAVGNPQPLFTIAVAE